MKRFENNPYYYFEYIVKKIENTDARSILDYGCGKGKLLSYLSKRKYSLYGYEADRDIKLKESLRKKIKIKYSDPQDKLPYKNGMFDIVVLSHVLEHVGNEEKCIRDISRVLKPGGYLLLASPYKGIFSWADSANLKYRFPNIHKMLYTVFEGKREYSKQFRLKKERFMYSDATLGVRFHKHYKEGEIRKFLGSGFNIIEFKKYSLFFPFIHLLDYLFQKILDSDIYVLTQIQRLDSKLCPGELSYNFVVYARKK